MKKRCLAPFLLIIAAITIHALQTEFPKLTGPYLGQKPPGVVPEIFAPGKISQAGFELHSSLAITHDGKEIYFTQLLRDGDFPRNVIMVMRYERERWLDPEVAAFSGTYNDANPSISGDGNKLYFSSSRPVEEGSEVKQDLDIWYLERRDGSWSEPRHLEGPINSELTEDAVSVSQKVLMYFYRNVGRENGWGDLFRSRLIRGAWTDPERVGDSVNTADFECFPVIARDESFLIFYARNGSKGPGQYICYRKSKETWTAPVNMGE